MFDCLVDNSGVRSVFMDTWTDRLLAAEKSGVFSWCLPPNEERSVCYNISSDDNSNHGGPSTSADVVEIDVDSSWPEARDMTKCSFTID